MNSAIAAKSFIVDDGKLLIIKRSDYTVQNPGKWDIPGGRLDSKEDIKQGLKRETKEETNLDIELIKELNKRRFTRVDNQKIDMTVFLCKALNKDVKLSDEHSEFEWIDINKAKEKLPDFFHKEVDLYQEIN